MKIELFSCEGSMPLFKGVYFPTSPISLLCLTKPGLLSLMLDLYIPDSGSEIQRSVPAAEGWPEPAASVSLNLGAALWAHRVNTWSEPCQRETSPLCCRSSQDFTKECIVGEDKRAAPCQHPRIHHMRSCPKEAVWQLGDKNQAGN